MTIDAIAKMLNLPKTWEEFCNTHPLRANDHFISSDSNIINLYVGSRDAKADRNALPSKDLTQAMLALCQLIQLRDCYNGRWKANWKKDEQLKYVICCCQDKLVSKNNRRAYSSVLAFKSVEIRNLFFKNFRDLIEIAKPLI